VWASAGWERLFVCTSRGNAGNTDKAILAPLDPASLYLGIHFHTCRLYHQKDSILCILMLQQAVLRFNSS
jgi:hypothetical protein